MSDSKELKQMTQKELSILQQQQIKELNTKVTTLESKMGEVSDDVKKILFHFNSDPNNKVEGFIEKTNRHDKELDDLKDVVKAAKAIAWFVGLVSGAIGSFFTWFFKP